MSVYPDYFASPLGVATCDSCERSWPCHLTAWGPSQAVSKCQACRDGLVSWSLPDREEVPV